MLAAAALVAALSFFAARDDSTTEAPVGPGTPVPAQAGALGERLRAGNVELRYGDTAGRAAAERLVREVTGGTVGEVAGEGGGGLAAAGQEVRAVREPGLRGVRALAWRRELRAADPRDPSLRGFVEHWLGRGQR
jgi:hypothetical protein